MPAADFISQLAEPSNRSLLGGILRGIEKEGLRADRSGRLALTPHPQGLGAALTHPYITTDYSESLLELITPPCHRIDTLIKWLDDLHRETYRQLGDEYIWGNSMPCILPSEQAIPVARYGSSNRGTMKSIYRLGLGHRYGRTMQTVAGVHYNFSLPEAFWALLQQAEEDHSLLQEFISRRYFDLIRNFRRHYWLLVYLFGATPAVDASFLTERKHRLECLGPDTFYLPHATSLRMGDLGYQSQAQESLHVCYNDSRSYVQSLVAAINNPYPTYERTGVLDAKGNYQQLNTGLLQIENEFYSSIRPKRTAKSGETALSALCRRGVEYIEVRCIDIDPFSANGVDAEQLRFIDAFLLYCLLTPSAATSPDETREILFNQQQVVTQGRAAGLNLLFNGQNTTFIESANKLLDGIKPLAELLDLTAGNSLVRFSWQQQKDKIEDPDKTPSARVLKEIINVGSFQRWALDIAESQRAIFNAQPLKDQTATYFAALAENSQRQQQGEETKDASTPFNEYLAKYYAQYQACCSGTIE
ncbi:MAG TPA: glutamate--cysteine ligase [Cellvibrionaceae bacterium]